MPRRFWIARSSMCISSRSFASRFDIGSSSSSNSGRIASARANRDARALAARQFFRITRVETFSEALLPGYCRVCALNARQMERELAILSDTPR